MSFHQKIEANLLRYEMDRKIPMEFSLGLDCVGEILIVDVYEIGGDLVGTLPSDGTVGNVKGTFVTIDMDFRAIPIASNYSLVVRTAETGLINKGPLVIFSEDGYTIAELPGNKYPKSPDAPTSLTIDTDFITSTSIRLDWVSNSSGEESGFQIWRSLDDVTYVPVATVASGVVQYNDTGLTPGTLYYYKVLALGDIPSGFTNIESAATAVPAPTDLLLTSLDVMSEAIIGWTNNSIGVDAGIIVEESSDGVNFSVLDTTAPDAVSYTHWSVCTIPLNFTVTVAKGSADLTWTSNTAGNETGFAIERSLLPTSGFTQIGTVGTGVLAFSDPNIIAGELSAYYYRVIATGITGAEYTEAKGIFTNAFDVSGYTPNDVDAAFFIIEANLTDSNHATYINTLVLDLKTGTVNGNDVWTDVMNIAIYPFIGGNATAHAVNLRNPGVHDLTFVNSPTHSSTGVDFDGATQYARTGIVPTSHMTLDNFTFSLYPVGGAAQDKFAIGTRAAPSFFSIIPKSSGGSSLLRAYTDSENNGRTTSTSTDAKSLLSFTKRSKTDYEYYRKAVSIDAQTETGGGSQIGTELYLAADNDAGSPAAGTYWNSESRLFAFGLGITDSENDDWSAAVEVFQTSLGREIA